MGGHQPFNREVMYAYVDMFSFHDTHIDTALRKFLAGFRLPGNNVILIVAFPLMDDCRLSTDTIWRLFATMCRRITNHRSHDGKVRRTLLCLQSGRIRHGRCRLCLGVRYHHVEHRCAQSDAEA